MTIFFISDTHFDHTNIIRFCNRPFQDVEEMNEKIIEDWNSVVSKNDEVWHLGDFSFSKDEERIKKHFDALNGKKSLLEGNHDHKETKNLPWAKVSRLFTMRHNKQSFVLCHYPMWAWDRQNQGSIHLYGHVHGKPNPIGGRSLDVGYDNGFSKPVSIDEITQKMLQIPVKKDF